MFVLRMLPEDLGLYFAFDETRIFVPIFVHSKRDCDVRCLTKRSMLSSIMAFTGVMYAIAREGQDGVHNQQIATCIDVGGS